MAKRKHKKRMGKWQRRGIFAACLIFGLLAGFGAGFLIQNELKHTNTASSSTARAGANQGPTAPTRIQAMKDYLKKKGIDSTDITFSVVSVSKTDPNWKLDQGSKAGEKPSYFILHKVKGGWTVVDYGTGFTVDQMKADGAPSDLRPPKQASTGTTSKE